MSQIDSINYKNSSCEYGILIGDKYSWGRESMLKKYQIEF